MILAKRKLENVKKDLVARREALAHALRQATVEFIEDETVFTDTVDQASADIDKSFALQMKDRERATLIQIDEALRRIDTGVFGECDRCGEKISEARLRAFPLTSLCIDCKAELESEENRFPRRLN